MQNSADNLCSIAVSEIRRHIDDSCAKLALMYSGGMDSSAVFCSLATANPNSETCLLFCNNGHFYPEELKSTILRNINEIRKKVKNSRISIWCFDCRELLINLGMRSLHDDMKRYPTCYLCCACKLCMHFVCASFCRDENISHLFDGYNRKQRYYPEQVPCFHEIMGKAVFSKFGVQSCSPLYNILSSRNSAPQLLKAFGLDPNFFDREKGGQAICSLGGSSKPPRTINGEVDENRYKEFEMGVREYTGHKVNLLCGQEEIFQNRERGVIRKPSFSAQIEQASRSYERIL